MASELKRIEDYIALSKQMGEVSFLDAHSRGAYLLGLGIVGNLDEDRKHAMGTTLVAHRAISSDDLLSHSLVGRVWIIEKKQGSAPGPRITLGRSADNDLVINEYSISRKHCAFKYTLNAMYLIDTGSRNGTYVGDAQLEANKAFRLANHAKLVLGRFEFEFLTGEAFAMRVIQESTMQWL